MSKRPLLLTLIVLFAVFFLSSCNSSDSSRFASALIGAEGGSVTSGDGSLTLEVPPGALSVPTRISIVASASSVQSLLLYQLNPSGLEFALPARMTVDVTSILNDSDASNLQANRLPSIITLNRERDATETLENMSLTMDADANAFLLSGDISHFSRFVVGGDLKVKAAIDNVPQFWPANSDFGPVEVTIQNGQDQDVKIGEERLASVFYRDSSIAPVIFKDMNQNLTPRTESGQTRTYGLIYACGDAGIGTYRAALRFTTLRSELVTRYTREEINIAAAFLLAFGDAVTGGDSRLEITSRFEFYTLRGMRLVNCGGSAPVSETPEPTTTPTESESPSPTSESTPSPDPTVEPTAEPTEEPTVEPTAEPTPDTSEAPRISASASNVSIDHTIGSTECPTRADPITVESVSGAELDVSISENLPFLDLQPGSGTTSNGEFQFTPSFPCSGYSPGANQGSFTISAIDPNTGLSSNTITIPVVVTVN